MIKMKKGKHHSEETKKKISDKKRGKHPSEETKMKMSKSKSGEKNPMYGKYGKDNPFYGKHHSEATRKKMRDARKGIKLSEEHKRKLSIAKQNMSEETKRKMSKSKSGEKNHNYGKKFSEETKRKMSLARKEYWRKKKEQHF